MTLSRRSLFGGLAGLLAAPAIVRAASIMPGKALPDPWSFPLNPRLLRVPVIVWSRVTEGPFAGMMKNERKWLDVQHMTNDEREQFLRRLWPD